jgi:outer membrane protein assembly factor BamA
LFCNIILISVLTLTPELSLDLQGNVFFSTQYLIGKKTTVRDQTEIENLISAILDKYNNAGFPFCRISPQLIYVEENPSVIVLTIHEGNRIIIEELLLGTEGKTDVRAAKRLAHFPKGEYFSLRNITQAKRRLNRTKAFTDISENVLQRSGKYYVMFSLEEKESDYLTLSGSLSDAGFEFGASYSTYSLLGTLRQFGFNYEYQRLFALNFREPVLIAPAAFEADFTILTYDSTRQIEGSVRFRAPLGAYFNASVVSGIALVTHYGTDTIQYQTSDNMLGTGLEFDYETSIFRNAQSIDLDYLFRDADRLRVRYDSETDVWQFNIGIHYHHVRTDSFEFFDYLRVGGADDLRGYLEDEFLAARALWFNLEYHRLFLYPIFDIGLIQDEIVYSYGFGVEAKSRFADASMVLAWPKGGTWDDGKFHLLLSRGF